MRKIPKLALSRDLRRIFRSSSTTTAEWDIPSSDASPFEDKAGIHPTSNTCG
jgi:hypothetical protein